MKLHNIFIFVLFVIGMQSTLLAQDDYESDEDQTYSYGIDKSLFSDRYVSRYKGVRFLYYNILQYDGIRYQPPFPYVDGRVRNGKYKASSSAMENYVKSLDKYNGKAFSILKLDDSNGVPSLIMICENKDTLSFEKNIVQGQFIREDVYKNARKQIGSKVYYISEMSNGSFINNVPKYQKELYKYFLGFTNLKTGEKETYLPYLSQWKIKDVRYDRTYIGERNATNDELNTEQPVRIKYIIENPEYGTYEIFPFNQQISFSSDLIGVAPFQIDPSFSKKELAKMEEWANKGYVEALFTRAWIKNEFIENGIVPQACITSAQKGYIVAVEAILNTDNIKNVSIEDESAMLKAAKQRYGNDFHFVHLDIQLEKKILLNLFRSKQITTSDFIKKTQEVSRKYDSGKADLFSSFYLDVLNLYIIPERNKMLKQGQQSKSDTSFYNKLLKLYDQELELVKAFYGNTKDDSFYSWAGGITATTRYLRMTKDIVEFNKEKITDKGSSSRDFKLEDKIYDLIFKKDALIYMEEIIRLTKKGCRENGPKGNFGIYFDDLINTQLAKSLKSVSQTDLKLEIVELMDALYSAANKCGKKNDMDKINQVKTAIENLKNNL